MSVLDFEVKYILPAHRAPLVRNHLGRVCRRDLEHPAAWVHTIYYDTVDLVCLDEKLNSDYLKTKVRLRWYRSLASDDTRRPEITSNVFSEVKWRRGSRRSKRRTDTGLPGETLASLALTDPRLLRLPRRAAATAGRPTALFPVLELRYRRDRFVDALNGARISLDSQIAILRAHPRFLHRTRPGELAVAVAEHKSPDAVLPPSLRDLITLGARRESFSKYHACFLAAA